MSTVPINWTPTTLGRLGAWGSGGTPRSTVSGYYGGKIPWIRSGDLPDEHILSHVVSISEEGLANSSARWVPENALLIALYGATIGKLGITTYPVTTNQAVAFCVPDEDLTSAEFLFWYLLSARPDLIGMGQGGAQPNISQAILKTWPLSLPPLSEQRRIVAKLSGLFDRLTSARLELARVPSLLERYKQTVLASAFSGRLTSAWRTSHGLSHADWKQRTIGESCIDVRYGTASKCYYKPVATPVLRIPNVVNGRIDLLDLKYGSFSSEEIRKLELRSGDVLVIRSNGSLDLVGRAAPIPNSLVGYLYAGYLIRLRFNPELVNPAFVAYAFDEPSIRRRIEGLAKSTSGVNNINSEQLKAISLAFPTLAEQAQIVDRVEAAFMSVDHVRAEAERSIQILKRLEQATLTKAFRGELVPQDPTELPIAETLTASGDTLVGRMTRQKSARATMPRSPKEKAAMTKSRQDEDVNGKPYLANLLKEAKASSVEDLFRKAELPVADFYKQLAWEVQEGHIKDHPNRLEVA